MTADSEWDSAFSQLESDGVHVVLYPDTSSALYIHAKVIDVDSTKAFVGSENFSTASLDYNRELGLITSSASVLGPLNATLSAISRAGSSSRATSTAPPVDDRTSDTGRSHAPRRVARRSTTRVGATSRANTAGTTTTGRPAVPGTAQTITCEDENGTWYWEST